MRIRRGTRPLLRGAEPRRVVAQHVSRPPCVTADVGCTAAPVRELVPRRAWQDRGVRGGSTGCTLQKLGRNKNAYVGFSDKVGSY